MTVQIGSIDHVAIRVRNMEESAQWYAAVFGFAVRHRWSNAWLLERGASRLGLYDAQVAVAPDDPTKLLVMHHFAFQVSAEAMVAALASFLEQEISFDGPKDSGLFWSVFVTDPDGYRVELVCFHSEATDG